MRRFLLALAMMALAISLAAQTSTDKTAEPSDAPCLVAGRVVTAAGGHPLTSATVVLVPDLRSDHRVYAGSSDSEGHFLVKDIPPGRYQFFAIHPGFVDQGYQSPEPEDGVLLSLKPGQKVNDALFRMTAAAVIAGVVHSDEGDAMVGTQVLALRRRSPEEIEEDERPFSRKQKLRPVAEAHTDDRGQYRIFGLKPGEYYILVTQSAESDSGMLAGENYWVAENLGSEYAPVYYPGVMQLSQAQEVSVKAGDEVLADFSVQRIKTVEVGGQVIGLNGPAKNVWVVLFEPDEELFASIHQTTADETGKFRLKGIPPGNYMFVAVEQHGNTTTGRTRQTVEVGGENIESLIISLAGGTAFSGRVSVAGPGSVAFDEVRVSLLSVDEDDLSSGEGHVEKDGTFEITSVPEGDYAVQVQGLEHDWYVKSVRLGSNDVMERGLRLEKGAAGGKLEVVVSAASAQLEGLVTDGDRVIMGAHVRITPHPETPYNRGRSHTATTDQTGRFSVTGLAPGEYRVIARSARVPGSDSLKSDPQIVNLSEHDHKTLHLAIAKPQSQ